MASDLIFASTSRENDANEDSNSDDDEDDYSTTSDSDEEDDDEMEENKDDDADEMEESNEIEGDPPEASRRNSADSEVCPICLNDFVGQELGTPQSCTHIFCLDCITEWSKNINTCPVDRTEFSYIYVRVPNSNDILKKIKVKMKPKEPEDALPEDTTACEVCRLGDHEDRLLLCDACDLAYHCECLNPPLRNIPIEQWFCPSCSEILQHQASTSGTSRRTRVIARTIASEAVRSRIQHLREYLENYSDDDYIPILEEMQNRQVSRRSRPPTPAPQKKRAKRRKTRRRKSYTRTFALARTKNSASFSKGNIGQRQIITVRSKRRRRKRRCKRKVTSKRSTLASKPLAAPSIKKRIANRLGLVKPPSNHMMPYVKSSMPVSVTEAQERPVSLQLFGTNHQLMDFDEEPFAEPNAVTLQSKLQTSRSRPNSMSSTTEAIPSTSGIDILGNIMNEQNLLNRKSEDIVICHDGSLKVREKSNNIKTSKVITKKSVNNVKQETDIKPSKADLLSKLKSERQNSVKVEISIRKEDSSIHRSSVSVKAEKLPFVNIESKSKSSSNVASSSSKKVPIKTENGDNEMSMLLQFLEQSVSSDDSFLSTIKQESTDDNENVSYIEPHVTPKKEVDHMRHSKSKGESHKGKHTKSLPHIVSEKTVNQGTENTNNRNTKPKSLEDKVKNKRFTSANTHIHNDHIDTAYSSDVHDNRTCIEKGGRTSMYSSEKIRCVKESNPNSQTRPVRIKTEVDSEHVIDGAEINYSNFKKKEDCHKSKYKSTSPASSVQTVSQSTVKANNQSAKRKYSEHDVSSFVNSDIEHIRTVHVLNECNDSIGYTEVSRPESSNDCDVLVTELTSFETSSSDLPAIPVCIKTELSNRCVTKETEVSHLTNEISNFKDKKGYNCTSAASNNKNASKSAAKANSQSTKRKYSEDDVNTRRSCFVNNDTGHDTTIYNLSSCNDSIGYDSISRSNTSNDCSLLAMDLTSFETSNSDLQQIQAHITTELNDRCVTKEREVSHLTNETTCFMDKKGYKSTPVTTNKNVSKSTAKVDNQSTKRRSLEDEVNRKRSRFLNSNNEHDRTTCDFNPHNACMTSSDVIRSETPIDSRVLITELLAAEVNSTDSQQRPVPIKTEPSFEFYHSSMIVQRDDEENISSVHEISSDDTSIQLSAKEHTSVSYSPMMVQRYEKEKFPFSQSLSNICTQLSTRKYAAITDDSSSPSSSRKGQQTENTSISLCESSVLRQNDSNAKELSSQSPPTQVHGSSINNINNNNVLINYSKDRIFNVGGHNLQLGVPIKTELFSPCYSPSSDTNASLDFTTCLNGLYTNSEENLNEAGLYMMNNTITGFDIDDISRLTNALKNAENSPYTTRNIGNGINVKIEKPDMDYSVQEHNSCSRLPSGVSNTNVIQQGEESNEANNICTLEQLTNILMKEGIPPKEFGDLLPYINAFIKKEDVTNNTQSERKINTLTEFRIDNSHCNNEDDTDITTLEKIKQEKVDTSAQKAKLKNGKLDSCLNQKRAEREFEDQRNYGSIHQEKEKRSDSSVNPGAVKESFSYPHDWQKPREEKTNTPVHQIREKKEKINKGKDSSANHGNISSSLNYRDNLENLRKETEDALINQREEKNGKEDSHVNKKKINKKDKERENKGRDSSINHREVRRSLSYPNNCGNSSEENLNIPVNQMKERNENEVNHVNKKKVNKKDKESENKGTDSSINPKEVRINLSYSNNGEKPRKENADIHVHQIKERKEKEDYHANEAKINKNDKESINKGEDSSVNQGKPRENLTYHDNLKKPRKENTDTHINKVKGKNGKEDSHHVKVKVNKKDSSVNKERVNKESDNSVNQEKVRINLNYPDNWQKPAKEKSVTPVHQLKEKNKTENSPANSAKASKKENSVINQERINKGNISVKQGRVKEGKVDNSVSQEKIKKEKIEYSVNKEKVKKFDYPIAQEKVKEQHQNSPMGKEKVKEGKLDCFNQEKIQEVSNYSVKKMKVKKERLQSSLDQENSNERKVEMPFIDCNLNINVGHVFGLLCHMLLNPLSDTKIPTATTALSVSTPKEVPVYNSAFEKNISYELGKFVPDETRIKSNNLNYDDFSESNQSVDKTYTHMKSEENFATQQSVQSKEFKNISNSNLIKTESSGITKEVCKLKEYSENKRKHPCSLETLENVVKIIKRIKLELDNGSKVSEKQVVKTESEVEQKHVLNNKELFEAIEAEVKIILKPLYACRKITKEAYKEIMKKCVPKIVKNCHNVINIEKIQRLVLSYVQMYPNDTKRKS